MKDKKIPDLSPDTLAVRAAVDSDPAHGAVMPPIYLSSNFTFAGYGQKRPYDYTRTANPTRDALGRALAALEGGAGASILATGMAALTLVFYLCRQGDCVYVPHDCYGGTFRLARAMNERGFVRVRFVDQGDLAALEAGFTRDRPTMILIETPSNPLLRVYDIAAIAALARRHGALCVADNTFLSPLQQRPLALGADIVVHSTTKFINGHSDVVGGAAIARTAEIHEKLVWWANCLGLTGAPFDSYLTLRGLRTLPLRVRRQAHSAERIAAFLTAHPAVERVHYPGLAGDPGHALAARQQDGFGSMISFALRGGEAAVRAFVEASALFTLAESLGGVESLMAHPATMTHAAMGPEARAVAGIADTLVRLSVGTEDAADLIADLDGALA